MITLTQICLKKSQRHCYVNMQNLCSADMLSLVGWCRYLFEFEFIPHPPHVYITLQLTFYLLYYYKAPLFILDQVKTYSWLLKKKRQILSKYSQRKLEVLYFLTLYPLSNLPTKKIQKKHLLVYLLDVNVITVIIST